MTRARSLGILPADLMISLAIILLIVVALIAGRQISAESLIAPHRPAQPVIALSAEGYHMLPSPDPLPLERAAELADRLAEAGQTPLLLIDPEGLEAHFMLSPQLAERGITEAELVRLERPCRALDLRPEGVACRR